MAELLCRSAFSGIPLRQDIVATDLLINWRGLAVGGVTQKVEGFFDTCKLMGLDGNQEYFGVISVILFFVK